MAARSLEADRLVAESAKRQEVTTGTAAEVKYAHRRRGANVPQKRLNVLPNIVAARTCPKLGGTIVVVRERFRGYECQVIQSMCHHDTHVGGDLTFQC
mgnify:CR=1 FL=1